MSIRDLDRVFKPAGIAVVGASRKTGTAGNVVINNLLKAGYRGDILPVNPHYDELCGLPVTSYLSRLRHPVDLVVVATPPERFPGILKECGKVSPAGVILLASSLPGTDIQQNRRLESAIRKTMERGVCRLMGPDSFGIMASNASLNASYFPVMPARGGMAFLCQSGAICNAVLDSFRGKRIGISYMASLGAMADVCVSDLLLYFWKDPDVTGIALCLEDPGRIRGFLSAARAVSRTKPVFVMTAGRLRLPSTGTFSALDDRPERDMIYDAAFERGGLIRVKDTGEWIDVCELAGKQTHPPGRRLLVVSNEQVLLETARGAAAAEGLDTESLTWEALTRLRSALPDQQVTDTGILIRRGTTPEDHGRIMATLLQMDSVDAVLLALAPHTLNEQGAAARCLAGEVRRRGTGAVPVITAAWLGGTNAEKGRQYLRRAGIPVYETPETAARALSRVLSHDRSLERLHEIPPRFQQDLHFDPAEAEGIIQGILRQGRNVIEEGESAELLAAYGVEGPLPEQDGLCGGGIPFCVGCRKDPDFGPVILVGGIGVLEFAPGRCSVGLPPLDRLLARRLMAASPVWDLLRYSLSENGLEFIEEILVRLSRLVQDFPEITSVDITLVVAARERAAVRSSRITVDHPPAPFPEHLAIRPYPREQEYDAVTEGGLRIFVRPIRPDDASLLSELVNASSPASLYLRFFRPMKKLPPEMLARFTQIDYDRDIVLVALQKEGPRERMVGVVRLMADADVLKAEFAVLVGDPWQGRGVGAVLLQQALKAAKIRGMESVWGVALPENSTMLSLGRKLGFTVSRIPETKEYELWIDLAKFRKN